MPCEGEGGTREIPVEKHERTRGLSEAASMERPDIFEKAQML